ncbi:MAG: ribose transport system ATP-binding protein [Thermoleophilaceae bacterium]|nr:ribose transport system ATP-binding protein [Thermoleophilaceae bacterium]
MSSSTNDPAGDLLSVRGVAKAFGGEQALAGVDLALAAGEIRALVGENGAGKSTLVKILAGVVTRDAGEISVAGRSLELNCAPADVAECGLAFVHQDLGLIDTLSVAENVALDVGYARRFGLISFKETERLVAGALEAVGCAASPRALVGELAPDVRVMVAVARAFSADARVIVLDEVSSRLPGPDAARLTASLTRARDSGMAFVYVTHRLDEIFAVADTVSVLRDGAEVADARVADVDHDQLVEWIVGRPPERAEHARPAASRGGALLRVEGLRGGDLDRPLDFSVGAGEVLGISGLMGSGTSEVAAMLGGGARPLAGGATLDGVELALGRPAKLRAQGVSYVPGDRQGEGTISGFSVRENLFPDRPGGNGLLRRPRLEHGLALRLAERYGVRPAGAVEQPIETFSGGNQQKVVFGRALRAGPRLLVLDSPTAGVDVGARVELYRLMRAAADDGAAILLCSTDYEEVAAQADRALVLWRGHLTAELEGAALTVDRLTHASYARTEVTA